MFNHEDKPVLNTARLSEINKSFSLRCDAKQFEERYRKLEHALCDVETFKLNEFLPNSLVKGAQPTYIEGVDGIPVINTLSIQNMEINESDCRYISYEDYEVLDGARKLLKGDVLLTVDGGTSIGKPVLFDLDGVFTVDSHVVILRPVGMSPRTLVYLLASPLGQIQFNKAESGASGQTAVTEEDIRRFQFPRKAFEQLEQQVDEIDSKRTAIRSEIKKLEEKETALWDDFVKRLF